MRYLIFLSLFFYSAIASAQENIKEENIRKHIYTLASDSMEGRGTGKPGQRMAAEYISGNFAKSGLIPAGNSKENPYLQRFCIYHANRSYAFISADTVIPKQRLRSSVYIDNEYYSVVFDQNSYRNDLHFLYISSVKHFNDSIRSVVYAGKPGDKIVSRNNPVVLIDVRDIGEAKEQIEQLHKKQNIKSFIIKISGSKLEKVLVNFPEDRFLTGNESGKKEFYKLGMLRPHKTDFPGEIFDLYSFCMEHMDCEIIIAGPQIMKAIFPGKDKSNPALIRYSAYTSGLWDSTETENVAGLLEGKSKDLIVVGAHYDHTGKYENDIYYGADDNASGTSAVMEIAREMSENAKAGNIPAKSILFVPFTAEEEGLIGSEAFLLNYPFPDRKIKYMVNMDMIGRNDKRNDTLTHYVYCLPLAGKKRKMIRSASEASNEVLKTNIVGNPDVVNRLLYRFGSDHHGFVRRGIHSVVFFTGLHDDYHKPTDTPDKIWYSNTTAIAKVVCRTIYIVAGEK